MLAFTRLSQQLGLKVRDAQLHSTHHTSLIMRLIIANKEKGARTILVGQALHKRIISNPKEGTNHLKFIYDLLYNAN